MKLRLLAATGVLAITAGTGGAGLLALNTASAATPSCGTACIDIYNEQFGDGAAGHPGFLVDSYKQGVATGTPVILFRESNSDPALDFVIEDQGDVSTFFELGLVSAATALHYGCIHGAPGFPAVCPFSPLKVTGHGSPDANLEAYEIEYAPFGAATGQCIGVATAPVQGEHVTLQPCGVSSKTVWIVDLFDGALGKNPFPAVPLINGANSSFSHPFVLSYPGGGYPTDIPRPVIQVRNLSAFFTGIFPNNSTITADVSSDQEWDAFIGPVQG